MKREYVWAAWTAAGAALTGVVLQSLDLGHVPWAVARSSGLVAMGLLTASTMFGLMLTTQIGKKYLAKPKVFELHQFASVLSVALILLHGGALTFDRYIGLSAADVLVPFAAGYERVWTGLGVIAGWLTVGVTASYWAKKRIGHTAWRQLHFASFGAWYLGLMHGLLMGTDTRSGPIYWALVLGTAAVGALIAARIAAGARGRRAARERRNDGPATFRA